MKVIDGKYKNLDSVILENDKLRVEIVPSAGARTASMIYKATKSELLWQNPAASHAPVQYAQPFPEGEGAGFDEMFPTINECPYPDHPWKGAVLPDHGEVWSLPWNCSIEKTSINLRVYGVRLPYSLTKRVSLEGSVLKAVYQAANLSPFPMPFVYAAHPLFNVDEGDRIIVPGNLNTITNAVPSDSMPVYGEELEWTDSLAVMPKKMPSGYKKYYFTEKNTEGWSVLRRVKSGLEIRMSASSEQLPWLGIWMNEGGWADQYNLALEPASAPMDDLSAARQWGRESILSPNEVIEWELSIAILPLPEDC